MYKRELDALIASDRLPSSLLLYGEAWFVDHYTRLLLERSGAKEQALILYFDEYVFESAKNYLVQPSLFGDRSVLVLRHERKIPKKELDVLVEACRKNPNSTFLFAFSGPDRAAKELARSFTKKKDADFVRFFAPNMREAIQHLEERARALGVQIESFALQHLYLLQNEDLALSMKELEKLSLLEGAVTAADVDAHVYGMGEISLEKFIARLLAKEDIREELERLLEAQSADEIRIVNAVQNHITQLFLFYSYIKVHGRYDAVEILGYPLPPQIAKERAAQAIRLALPAYRALLSALMEAEYTLKKGVNIDKSSYLFSTLIKLQTYL